MNINNESNTITFARIVTLLATLIIVAATYFFFMTPVGEKKKYQPESALKSKVDIGGEFELINMDNKLQNTKEFAGKPRLVYFGFTYCPDVCPTALNLISGVINDLDRYTFEIVPIFITIDPERDTLDVLKPYLSHFHPKIVGFTGSLEQIEEVAKLYKVFFAKVPNINSDKDYLVDHSSFIYLLDDNANYITHFASSSSVSEIVNYIRVKLINKD